MVTVFVEPSGHAKGPRNPCKAIVLALLVLAWNCVADEQSVYAL